MDGLNPLAGMPLTDQDVADEELLRKLLTAPDSAFGILQDLTEDEALLSVVMCCLDMTRLVIEACTARLARDNSLPVDKARFDAIRLMEQWGPAPLAVAFGTPAARGDIYAAINWLSVVTTPSKVTIADLHGAAAMAGVLEPSDGGVRYSIPIKTMLDELAAAGIEVGAPPPRNNP